MGLTSAVKKIRARILKLMLIQSKLLKIDKRIEEDMRVLLELRNADDPMYDGTPLEQSIVRLSTARHTLKTEATHLQTRIDRLKKRL